MALDTIPYALRVRLGKDVPIDGQTRVMKRLPVFDGPETFNLFPAPKMKPASIRAAVFNMEHGYRIREIAPFLTECPDLMGADILFGNEMDDGTERSGNIDTARALADLLGYNYVYALEFIELVNPRDRKGYEGNVLFSKWPIVRATSFYPPAGYDWYFDEQVRIGGRVAVLAELDICGTRVGTVCVHLENRTTPEFRAVQTKAILDAADDFFGEIPILVGGDFNSNAFEDSYASAKAYYDWQRANGGAMRDVERFEPLLPTAERAGYDYKRCNGEKLITRRKPMDGGDLGLHLDWIFSKRATCTGHGLVSTLREDCGWAAPDSPVRAMTERQLSDHNAVWADFLLD
ncbi:MAG: endonuclease/exonuclease/phosphatase family protein [Clostridia bacterium]|nr:endonuclease/exonuclease/phosphatase family protein [Clostridia bacterium]